MGNALLGFGKAESSASGGGEEDELIHVDTGDSLKVKQVLDEAVVKAVLSKDYVEVHRIENLKVLLMVVACLFAMTAQFYPMPFPESRPLLGVCCSGYFVFSGILQLAVKFVEREAILVTAPKKPAKLGIRVSTSFPRYQDEFTTKIQYDTPLEGSKNNKGTSFSHAVEETHSVGNFFDADGYLWEDGFKDKIAALVDKFEAKKDD